MYQLGHAAARQIQELIKREILKAEPALRARLQHDQPGLAVYLAETPAGGIAAMASDVPGSAVCTVKGIDADGSLVTITDSTDATVTVTVYNVASNAVDGDTVIQCKQEMATGKLLADFEDCD